MRKGILSVGVLALVLLAGACGGGGGGPILLDGKDNFTFTPNTISATAGQKVTVELKNSGVLEHSFVVEELKVSLRVPAGQTKDVPFTPASAGTYTFYCDVAGHREAGMTGTLTVK